MNVSPYFRRKQVVCCAICGSSDRIEQHHLGGRAHAAYFRLPLCGRHHVLVSRMIANAAPDLMTATSNHDERLRRARMAAMVFLWMVEECCTDGNSIKEITK